ncbi:MAG: helix-turn-helix domain-containing protein [Mycobacteriales bacterium]
MHEVARAAGVSQGTIYRHFPTRGVLVLAATTPTWSA